MNDQFLAGGEAIRHYIRSDPDAHQGGKYQRKGRLVDLGGKVHRSGARTRGKKQTRISRMKSDVRHRYIGNARTCTIHPCGSDAAQPCCVPLSKIAVDAGQAQ